MRTRRKKHKDREAAILLSSLFRESHHLHHLSLLCPAVKLSIKRSEFSSSQIHLPLQTILHITFGQSLGTSVHVAHFRNCYFQISFHVHDNFLSITLPGKRVREERWYKEAWSIFSSVMFPKETCIAHPSLSHMLRKRQRLAHQPLKGGCRPWSSS